LLYLLNGMLYCCNCCKNLKPAHFHSMSGFNIVYSILHTPTRRCGRQIFSLRSQAEQRQKYLQFVGPVHQMLFVLTHFWPIYAERKYTRLRSGLRGDHVVGPQRPIHLPRKSSRHVRTENSKCFGAPFCIKCSYLQCFYLETAGNTCAFTLLSTSSLPLHLAARAVMTSYELSHNRRCHVSCLHIKRLLEAIFVKLTTVFQ
jgi:hypothetical protein